MTFVLAILLLSTFVGVVVSLRVNANTRYSYATLGKRFVPKQLQQLLYRIVSETAKTSMRLDLVYFHAAAIAVATPTRMAAVRATVSAPPTGISG